MAVNWFPHDSSALYDEKLKVLRKRHGFAGLGIFWLMVEICYENSGRIEKYKLPIIFEAEDITDGNKTFQTMLELKLFRMKAETNGEDYYYSERIDRELSIRQELSKKRSDAGREGGLAKSRSANKAKEPIITKQVLASAKQSLAKPATVQDSTGHDITKLSQEKIAYSDEDVIRLGNQFTTLALDQQWDTTGDSAPKVWLQHKEMGKQDREEFYRKVRVMFNSAKHLSTMKLAKKIYFELAGFVNDKGQMQNLLSDKEAAERKAFAEEESGKNYVESEL